jgi:D-3-phosphoglycerate dehydrogenase
VPTERPRILIADPIADEGIGALNAAGDVEVRTGLSEDDLAEAIPAYAALVVRSETKVTRRVFERARRLVVVGRAGVGVDNIDLQAATERGVIVVNAPHGNTIAAAEHTIGLLFALARHIPAADASLHAGRWQRKDFIGTEIRGKTLGIIGLGNVGSEVARRAQGLEMRVIGNDPFIPAERANALGVESVDLAQLFAESDFITVHVPLTAANQGMIGEKEIAAMKPGVRLINVARGGVIDEGALVEAVRAGKVAGAAVDVFSSEPPAADDPLLHQPGIIVTPHLGASTAEAQGRAALDVAEQIIEVLNGRPARYAVNAPMLAPETLKVVGPYMKVAELVGSVATQLVTGQLMSIQTDYYGEISEHDVTPLRASVIRGLLRPISDESVNIVNANLVAQSRGWLIEERLRPSHEVFHNLILLKVGTSDAEVSVGGTIEHGHPHIVIINGLDIDLMPEPGGVLLACDNIDRPGMIGRLGTLLGQFDINISSMQVGRRAKREQALMLVQVDEAPTEEQLQAISDIDGIENVRMVRF